jgi:hypothetical protein
LVAKTRYKKVVEEQTSLDIETFLFVQKKGSSYV